MGPPRRCPLSCPRPRAPRAVRRAPEARGDRTQRQRQRRTTRPRLNQASSVVAMLVVARVSLLSLSISKSHNIGDGLRKNPFIVGTLTYTTSSPAARHHTAHRSRDHYAHGATRGIYAEDATRKTRPNALLFSPSAPSFYFHAAVVSPRSTLMPTAPVYEASPLAPAAASSSVAGCHPKFSGAHDGGNGASNVCSTFAANAGDLGR